METAPWGMGDVEGALPAYRQSKYVTPVFRPTTALELE
ncbi:hypothetical protein PF005_g15251 [Phytophthora fragariae]|uniref:Uncharacterized protein n=1 Tax=Phytophthora fragariae TaxID=53985 RepID=A0A6A3XDF9_9STRA|nr:hypothetical protein PF005_g15251 [Phytophthora fragariae]